MFIDKTAYTDPAGNVPGDRPLGLAILGATGSIGRQTLDIAAAFPERFAVRAVAVNRRVDEAVEICRRFVPTVLAVCDERAAARAVEAVRAAGLPTKVIAGAEAMSEAALRDDVDTVVTATVGYSGLIPTLDAIRAGKDIALANKETLVVAGEYIARCLKDSTTRIFPVDSEHSAIAQCLRGEDMATVKRLIITASGGPFRTWSRERLEHATAADALRHPNWNMGAKITVDSATMMNKAFEIIEARWLFGIPGERIEAVVHPQSIVHSMVEFDDGAVKAQLGVPDMHLPIAYALGMNHRVAGSSAPLTIEKMANLTFETPDADKFPCLGLARTALERRGNTACVINAANEIAVDAFLNGRIRFTDIYTLIEKTLGSIDYVAEPGIDDYIETNRASRAKAAELTATLPRPYACADTPTL